MDKFIALLNSLGPGIMMTTWLSFGYFYQGWLFYCRLFIAA